MAIEYLYFIYIVIYNQIYTKIRRGLLMNRFSIFINLLKKKKKKRKDIKIFQDYSISFSK